MWRNVNPSTLLVEVQTGAAPVQKSGGPRVGSTGDEGKTQHRWFKGERGPGGTVSSDGETVSPDHGLPVYLIGVG